ncbi:putative Cytochrome C family protein [Candidatus Zixiibacteriota bacterium]|nr:putative Cytochrome C family protein [candidate division Zixibacteria bacterium]
MITGILLSIWLVAGTSAFPVYNTPANLASLDDIIFSHSLHADSAGVDCELCHGTVYNSTAAADVNLPKMSVCGSCHDAVKDSTRCGMCHHNVKKPFGFGKVERLLIFSHKAHLSRGQDCSRCHSDLGKPGTAFLEHLPDMNRCYDCHDGKKYRNECSLCHADKITLSDIHPSDWRHNHGDRATNNREWCNICHRQESYCTDCHRGDNITGRIHDLNYQFTHGLDAQSKSADCRKCHETKSFCDNCHNAGLRMPLNHSTVSWRIEHGAAARNDVENCASCHDNSDPTCARGGCHRDFDGIKGTDPRIHIDSGPLSSHGPWHEDENYYCYQCHLNTHQAGQGFCGYCHGAERR